MVEISYIDRQSIFQHCVWKKASPLLTNLDIELTERCNNACIHCYINLAKNDLKAQSTELCVDEWKRILREAGHLGAMFVRFTGGEPLLRDDFQDIYLFTRKLGMKVLLFTNARLVTPELADLFSRVPPLEKIEITSYGMHPGSYEAVSCSPGSFQEFRRGVDLLLEKQVPFIVKGALLPPNQHEREEFEAWAATIPWMERPPSYSMNFDLRGRRDSEAKNRLIRKLRANPEETSANTKSWMDRDPREVSQFCAKFMGSSGDALFACGAGTSGCIDAYGMYQPCMMLRDPSLAYDLRKGSLEDALKNFFPKLREMKATNPEYLARCAKCFIKGLCEQCPAKSWAEHGTLDTPVEYFCQVAHVQARTLGLLSEGEKAWEVTDGKERVIKIFGEPS